MLNLLQLDDLFELVEILFVINVPADFVSSLVLVVEDIHFIN